MIILDEDDLVNSKDPPVVTSALRYPERAAGRRPFSHLPDYETSQALAFTGFNNSLITFHKPPAKRRILDSKFWRASIASLVFYIFLTIVVGIPIIIKRTREAPQQSYPHYSSNFATPRPNEGSPSIYVTDNNISGPLESGIVPICNNWSYVAQLEDMQQFLVGTVEHIVSSSGQFSITSNASFTSSTNIVMGDMFVGINSNSTETDATISIRMQASSMDLFEQTLVCFGLTNNLTGLSIQIPDNLALNDQLLFNITLLYPQSPIPAKVDSFSTYLPLFTQTFGNFGDFVEFKKVSIEGPVSKIFAHSLQADKMVVETALESISGQFYATDSLIVSTIQAPVHANITIYNDPDSNFPTYLEVSTGNSNLTVNVTMISPNNAPPVRPNFIANLRTFSGIATASFTHDQSSPPTVIKLRLENDLGLSNITLDQKYQGVFQVSTKLGSVTVTQGNADSLDPWDPTLQRMYVLDYNSTARKYGWIGWGAPSGYFLDEPQGEVVVESSIADCTLFFDG